MNLHLRRRWYYENFTGGDLYVDGSFFCRTLEDRVRDPGEKVDGETAIPSGMYRMELTMSKRFGRILPEVIGVKNFAGIRIHSGNSSADTRGCILVGVATEAEMSREGGNRTKGRVTQSRVTMERLQAAMMTAEKRGENITLTIE